ncbi:glycolate oxidase subunit GlcF [uncultured Rhodoblastus sp.]|uniref:glycolate oxidase subunit GlcF n=1 Tax=uncultured Rhodoblastus sp. TaxID=543037 RepID=UPI0025F2E0E2|nr:glycolate oxidase subunit GlcF [uncultured Rhodoblastus sp.]
MQTHFSLAQLANSDTAVSEKILRSCVHCGFCIATCPTYALLGDELDSPRGRIYLIKDMLENDRPATGEVVKHIDRCLSCLSCMTTCPSGVHYGRLVDHARHHIERTYRRPWFERSLRRLLGIVLPRPHLFRAALTAAVLAKPFAKFLPASLRARFDLIPTKIPDASPIYRPHVAWGAPTPTRRVALLAGCAQQVLKPQIDEAMIRLLTRHGCEVAMVAGTGCCGAFNHHLGQDGGAFARANILAWSREIEAKGLDAIVINASGCGTMVKEYGFMFRDDPAWSKQARLISSLTCDISELMTEIGVLPPVKAMGQRVAYHSACSLQHGQNIRNEPKLLLKDAGFIVLDPPEGHLCCGSAGAYNMLQPEIATQLRDRKAANLESTAPDLIAAGNIGCIVQIAAKTALPVVHTVELLDWATGGPRPPGLSA